MWEKIAKYPSESFWLALTEFIEISVSSSNSDFWKFFPFPSSPLSPDELEGAWTQKKKIKEQNTMYFRSADKILGTVNKKILVTTYSKLVRYYSVQ